MLRIDDNPDARFPLGRPLSADHGCWCVGYVKSRQEKALAHDLTRRGISYYLPMAEKRVRRRDNKKIRKTLVPLFPGYLALAADEETRNTIYKTQRLSRILEVSDQEQFVQELGQVQRALESDCGVSLLPTFKPGQSIRVRYGPLQGLEGTVVRAKGKTQFVIRVQMFNQAVAVELDELHLELN